MRNLISSMAVLISFAVLVLSNKSMVGKAYSIEREPSVLIENTCEHTPNYKLCLSTVMSDGRSSSADVAGLALIVVDAVKAKATSMVTTINKLKKSKPEYKQELEDCSTRYNAILKADVPEAIEGLKKGDPKFAEDGMNDAAIEAEFCENNFQTSKTPLSSENQTVYNLSVVARAIIRMLL